MVTFTAEYPIGLYATTWLFMRLLNLVSTAKILVEYVKFFN